MQILFKQKQTYLIPVIEKKLGIILTQKISNRSEKTVAVLTHDKNFGNLIAKTRDDLLNGSGMKYNGKERRKVHTMLAPSVERRKSELMKQKDIMNVVM